MIWVRIPGSAIFFCCSTSLNLSFLFSHPLCHWCFHQRCAFSPTVPALLPEAHINLNNVKSNIPLHMCTTSLSIPLLMDM